MSLEAIKKALIPVSGHILTMFDTTEAEFTDRAVQEGFKFLEKNKAQNKGKDLKFWEGYRLNITKFSIDFRDGIMPQNPKATKEENISLFFNQLRKYSL
jgi:hypothetical protein